MVMRGERLMRGCCGVGVREKVRRYIRSVASLSTLTTAYGRNSYSADERAETGVVEATARGAVRRVVWRLTWVQRGDVKRKGEMRCDG